MSEAAQDIRARLPPAVYDLGLRLGARLESAPSLVTLTQIGRLKPKLDASSWLPFHAHQTISTRECMFDWRAKAGPLGVISARDALIGGEARFDILALGFIPIVRAPHSPALIRGELMRYLAELAWTPDAIFHNPSLKWRADSPERLAVSAVAHGVEAAVVLDLDTEGRITGAYATDRPRSASKPFLLTPWQGRFSDFRRNAGFWLPFTGQVAWVIDGVEEIYWEGCLQTWAIGPTSTGQAVTLPPIKGGNP